MEGGGAEKCGSGLQLPLADGEHHVRFSDGSEYYGEFKGGTMSGRGVFVWPNGDVYEGGWLGGAEDGVGAFLAAGGSSYYGTWKGGNLHGQGVYKPSGPGNRRAKVVFMREYRDGELLSEAVLRVAEKDVRKKEKKAAKKQAKQAYTPPKPGERIYKGHGSYRLMRELQLGIMFSIAQAGQSRLRGAHAGQASFWQAGCLLPSIQEEAPGEGELREKDFEVAAVQYFPSGSETEPFKWKDYSPRVFHKLRQAFGIDNRDYLLSITGGAALRELPSPGKSGSVFFLSDDDRYIVKTVRAVEMRLLLELIPRYYRHVLANPTTLLVHFYGVHRISPALGRRVRFIVMGNVLPSDLRLHRKYDLKGSIWQRSVGKQRREGDPNATLKDLDLDMQLVLSPETHALVMRQLERDCNLLEELRVMDYSLLLGVHFQNWGNFRWAQPGQPWPAMVPLLGPQKVPGSAHENQIEQPLEREQQQQEEEGQGAEQRQQEEEGQGPELQQQEQQQGEVPHGPASTGAEASLAASQERAWAQHSLSTAPSLWGGETASVTAHSAASEVAGKENGPIAAAPAVAGAGGAVGGAGPGARPSALFLRRSASEGIRGLLAMLQQPHTQQEEGGQSEEDPCLLQAAAAVVASAQNSRQAARQVAALVSVGEGSPAGVAPDLATPSMEVALMSEIALRPSPKRLLEPRGAAAAVAATAGVAANGWDGQERTAAGHGAGKEQQQQQQQQQQRSAALQSGGHPLLSFDSNASSEATGALGCPSIDSEGVLPAGLPPQAAAYCACPPPYPLAGQPKGGQEQSQGLQPQLLLPRAMTPESPTRQLGATPALPLAPSQQLHHSQQQQQGPGRPYGQPTTLPSTQQEEHQHPSSWACGIPLGGWACAACSPAAVAHEGATALGSHAAGPAGRQHAWAALATADDPLPTTGTAEGQLGEVPHTAAHGPAAVQLAEAAQGAAVQPPAAATTRVQATIAPAPSLAALQRHPSMGGETGSPLSRLSLSPLAPPVSVGQGVPALAVRKRGGCPPQPVLLYFGIIDFLQEYTVLKRAEHAWKAAVQDGEAVSVTDPHKYRKRFMRAMQDLFVLAPSPSEQ